MPLLIVLVDAIHESAALIRRVQLLYCIMMSQNLLPKFIGIIKEPAVMRSCFNECRATFNLLLDLCAEVVLYLL